MRHDLKGTNFRETEILRFLILVHFPGAKLRGGGNRENNFR